MKMIHGAVVAALLAGAPLAAQQHQHQPMRDSSTAQQNCMDMANMHGMMGGTDSAGMMRPHGMADSTMMTVMRFAPQAVLAHREDLDLTSHQVQRIDELGKTLADSPPLSDRRSRAAHMERMTKAADAVRDLLTPEQRTKVNALPAPCGMKGDHPGMSHGSH